MHPLNSAACPECGKDEVEGDQLDVGINGRWAVQPMSCLVCSATWTDHYLLHHRVAEDGSAYETRTN